MPIHYLKQCWNIVNSTLRNKLQWNFNQNSNIFIQENVFESVVCCEMVAILSQPQCVKPVKSPLWFQNNGRCLQGRQLSVAASLNLVYHEFRISCYRYIVLTMSMLWACHLFGFLWPLLMMLSWHGNAFYITVSLRRTTGPFVRGIHWSLVLLPHKVKLWCNLCH